MSRLVLGLVKGAVVGVAVGFLGSKAGISDGVLAFLLYGVLGGLVGVVCGKPLWRQETLWTPALKGIFGFLVGAGLYWGGSKLLGGFTVPMAADLGLARGARLADSPIALAPLIGLLYGAFVEIDDGGDKPPPDAAAKPKPKPGT